MGDMEGAKSLLFCRSTDARPRNHETCHTMGEKYSTFGATFSDMFDLNLIIFAFSYFYNIQTNTAAEAMAIRDGLLLCEERNLHDIVIESDSRVLVQMLRAGSCSHWRLQSTWTDIMRCRARITTITHQLREGNQTADALATHAVCTRLCSVFSSWQEMPPEARGRHRLEQIGMPALRIRRTRRPIGPRQWRIAWGQPPAST
ncbi:unnamed protein product [Spirodela intermedia]|uniref:RNase H type-1 domain-containing protein n=1 Tax=Spirodela intermedia TaxID=51605 RepID=A0ABN7E810_SPIIN|nr:unnamed protein product [Spirodela intermedia]